MRLVNKAKSGIHIKKKNRGKFTDYCGGTVTGECIARGKRSSNPAIRKRATFAANARKWKHLNGGILRYDIGGSLGQTQDPLYNIFKSAFNNLSSPSNTTFTPQAETAPKKFFAPAPQTNPIRSLTGKYDLDKAIKYLEQHARAFSSRGCAAAVRAALEAGGLDMSDRPKFAADYNQYLHKKGFRSVNKGRGTVLPNGYTPQRGDIIVFDRVGEHQDGHIAMYSGKRWISDFLQNNWYVYENPDTYQIWRYGDQEEEPQRKLPDNFMIF